MELNFIFVPTLEHITLVNIAISLWKSDYIKIFLSQCNWSYLRCSRKWNEIESKLLESARSLHLPELLTIKLSSVIKNVGLEILALANYHYLQCDFIKMPKDFTSKLQGAIDREKTANLFVNDNNLSIYERYTLACIYCLEDNIYILWNHLDEYYRNIPFRSRNRPDYYLLNFWSNYMKKKTALAASCPESLCGSERNETVGSSSTNNSGGLNFLPNFVGPFIHSASRGNGAATKYFFKKLSSNEKDDVLINTTRNVMEAILYSKVDIQDYFGVFSFLLSVMQEDQKTKILDLYYRTVLKCMLRWPFRDEFLKTADRVRDFMSEKDYIDILSDIGEYAMKHCETDYDYEDLFWVFWQQIPNPCKIIILNTCTFHDALDGKLFRELRKMYQSGVQ